MTLVNTVTVKPEVPQSAAAHKLVARTLAGFEGQYGREAGWLSIAPGRVNLIGEHVDYNDGLVLPMAVDRHMAMAAAPGSGPGLRVYSAAMGGEVQLDPRQRTTKTDSWASYIEGVYQLCYAKGLKVPALDVYIESDLPSGAGLSSSAALEVATATLLETVAKHTFPVWEKIQLCQKAEHEWAGVPCGIMDQASVVLAGESHLLQLDCRALKTQQVPFREEQVSVLITNSQVKHKLSDSPYAQRRAQCEHAAAVLGGSLRDAALQDVEDSEQLDAETKRRARHVITEIDRVEAMVQQVSVGDWHAAGRSLYESHDSLRDLFEVSCPELDLLVELARDIGPDGGMFGSRMTGGGFGGCTVSLIAASREEAITQAIHDAYLHKTGLAPAFIVSRPAAGARCIELTQR